MDRHTGLSAGMVLMSLFSTFACDTLATSLNFRPHSSVFVAKKIQEAATFFYFVMLYRKGREGEGRREDILADESPPWNNACRTYETK